MIKILIADDHRLVRESLVVLLESQPDMRVIGQAKDGHEAIKLTMKLKPDIVLMDLSMPLLNGIEAINTLTAQKTQARIIALSMHSNKRDISKAFSLGASGYLLKSCKTDDLIKAVRAVRTGNTYLCQVAKNMLVDDYIKLISNPQEITDDILTSREREITQLLAEGVSTKEAASLLNVSTKTIATHRNNIMAKLHITSIAELTKYAIRERITKL